MEYFMTARQRRGDGYGDRVGPVRYLVAKESDGGLHRGHEVSKSAWFAQVQREAGGSDERHGNVLFFIHGFNTDQGEMRARYKKIVAGLAGQFDCVVVGFDWPSDGSLTGYFADRTDARRVALEFLIRGIEPFAERVRDDCVVDLHVLAHSMGAFLLREAFDYADDRHHVARRNWNVAQVALVAADISQRSTEAGSSKISSLLRHATRLTNYWSPFDEVLSISSTKRIGLKRRLGRVGLPERHSEKLADLYCGALFREVKDDIPAPPGVGEIGRSHWWYFESARFYEDLAHTLSGKLDRDAIPTRGLDRNRKRYLRP